jgi:flagellar hook-length control protein FliK
MDEIQTEVKPTKEKIDIQSDRKTEELEDQSETVIPDVVLLELQATDTIPAVPVQAAPTPVVLEAPKGNAAVKPELEESGEDSQAKSVALSDSGPVIHKVHAKAAVDAGKTNESKIAPTAVPLSQVEVSSKAVEKVNTGEIPAQVNDMQPLLHEKPGNQSTPKVAADQPIQEKALTSPASAPETTSPFINLREKGETPVVTSKPDVSAHQPTGERLQAVTDLTEALPADPKTSESTVKPSDAGKNFTADTKQTGNSTVTTEVDAESQNSVQKVASNPAPANIKSDAKVVSYTNEGKPERKADVQALPETQAKEPPAAPPGVFDERMRTDPTTGKTYEPARLAEAQSTEILRQISRQIAGSSNSGNQTIRIQLHPEDLGQIELKIVSTPQGTNVSLVADQSSTGKLLESRLAELKQTLVDAGVQLINVNIGQQSPQQSFRNPQYDQTSERQSFKYQNVPAVAEESIANNSTSKISLVDYRI